MKNKFYKTSLWLVFGTSLLSILVSTLDFIAIENVADPESSLLEFLYYAKLVCDLLANFVGYATIFYAVAKLGWYDGLKSCGIYFISVLFFFVFQTVISTVYYKDMYELTGAYTDNTVNLMASNAFYSLGQLVITLMIPVWIIMMLSRRRVCEDGTDFKKFVSFKNPVQKAMARFCIIMAAINLLSFLLIEVLPYLIQMDFYITFTAFKQIMLSSLLSLLENILLYTIVQYIVFMLIFRLYDAQLNEVKSPIENKNNKKQKTKK